MALLSPIDLVVVFVAAFFTLVIFASTKKRSSLPYPPGPRPLPLLGNVHQFPHGSEWLAFDRWSREFGSDIIYLRTAGMHFLVVSSMEAVNDLFEKRSTIYSSRPQFPMASELMGWKWLFVAMEYGQAWRERRKMFTQYFHRGQAETYQSNHIKFVRGMLPALLDNPDNFIEIARHAVGGSALSMAYGLPIKPLQDPLVKLAEEASEKLTIAASPGNFLVNLIPVLKYVPEFVPGAGFKKLAREWRKLQEDFRELPFAKAVQSMKDGTAEPSFATQQISNLKADVNSDSRVELIKDTAGIVFQASSETTLSAVLTFFLAMTCYPEVQKKAQQELDRVLDGRLPQFSDQSELPYTSAIVKEVLRWKPPAPIAIPHATSEDDVYRGYFIPKGTLVIGNSWAMLHDEKYYPYPEMFNPDRFMKDGKLNPDVRDPALMVFGFGRRICPGSHIAQSILWLTVATILSTFNISYGLDEDGTPIKPSMEYQSAIIYQPMPFKCTLKPRSKDAEQRIRDSGNELEPNAFNRK